MDNVEEVITIEMHYIANADGYLQAVSFGAYIACDGVSCVEYVGTVPDGYASLEAWYADNCEQLHKWKVVDYNLVKDDNAPDPVESTDLWVGDNARLRTTDDSRGNLQLYNADGQLAVNAYATDKGIGEVDVHGSDGVARATLFVTAPTAETPNVGRLVLKNGSGDEAYLEYDDIVKLQNLDGSGGGGGVQMVRLWENAAPDSIFAAQTLAIENLQEFDAIAISAQYYAGYGAGTTLLLPTTLGVKGALTVPYYMIAYRNVTLAQNSLIFADGEYRASIGGSPGINNGLIVPTEIYGYKGVQ